MTNGLHLAINAIGVKHSGGAVVLEDFLNEAATHNCLSMITVFCSPRATRNFSLPRSQKIVEREVPLAELSYLYRLLWFQFFLGQECLRVGADVLFCMTALGRTRRHIPQVTLVQQSLPFSHEVLQRVSFKHRLRLIVMKWIMSRSCRSSKRVIVQTSTMKEWISKVFELHGQLIKVIMPSPPEAKLGKIDASIEQIQNVPSGLRLLYVGSQSPHKNVQTLIAGMQILRSLLPGATLFLTWPLGHQVGKLPGVICVGYLAGARLWKAYEQTTVLVMPSLVETVGLPMLEAMSVGTPVLAADRPYAREVCEDAAIFFEPLSPRRFAIAANRILRNKHLLLEVSQKGKALIARRHSTSASARMVASILEVVHA